MYRHVVMFNFENGIGRETRLEAVERLEQLGEVCPTIGAWSIGVNVANSPNAYDVVEIGDFATQEDLDAYKAHPSHVEFSEFIRPLATWALLDYEVTDKEPTQLWLKDVADIPPFSIVFNGARYRRSERNHPAYRALKQHISEFLPEDTTDSQLGKLAATLVKGDVPEGMFSFKPQVGITYNGNVKTGIDLARFSAHFGEMRGEDMISLFRNMTTTKKAGEVKPVEI